MAQAAETGQNPATISQIVFLFSQYSEYLLSFFSKGGNFRDLLRTFLKTEPIEKRVYT